MVKKLTLHLSEIIAAACGLIFFENRYQPINMWCFFPLLFKHVFLVYDCSCFEYIEEMIQKQEPLINVLRILILFSVTNSGLPKKHFDYLRQVLFTLYKSLFNVLFLIFCGKCMLVFDSWLLLVDSYFSSLTYWLGYLIYL